MGKKRSPKETLKKITDVMQPWESLRPEKSFCGRTLEQAKAAVQPSLDARARIADLEHQMQEAIAQRDAADAVSMDVIESTVQAVRADPAEGEDGPLYAAMGFIRKSLRATGLTRRRVNAGEAKSQNTGG